MQSVQKKCLFYTLMRIYTLSLNDQKSLSRIDCFLSLPQFIMRKIKEVDLEALAPSPECPADQIQRLKLAIPEV